MSRVQSRIAPIAIATVGLLVSMTGCMVPVYNMPVGFSGSYHRYLTEPQQAMVLPDDGMLEGLSQQPAHRPCSATVLEDEAALDRVSKVDAALHVAR